MEILTFDGKFCDIAMCSEVPGGSFCEDGYCSQRTRFGSVYVLPEMVIPEDKRLLNHIAQIQLVGLGREA